MESAIAPSKRKAFSLHATLFGSLGRVRPNRCAVIVAHPNDEVVGSGFLISKLAEVFVLHISNGFPHLDAEVKANNIEKENEYAEQRRRECYAALQIASVPNDNVTELNVPQFSIPFQLVALTKEVLKFLQRTSPQIILTHAYEGGHPDHDATAFATHAAVRLLTENGLKAPAIFEMALYPGKSGLSKVPEFLHSPARESTTLSLNRDAQDLKLKMFNCFKTHRQIFEISPLGPERFRESPGYDFTQPPHEGELYYENFDWGMTGEDWRALATEANRLLFSEASQKISSGSMKAKEGLVQKSQSLS
jgi:LmbE family N-acetylglucosaminyl deacetylase